MKVIDVPLKYKDGTSPRAILFTAKECFGWGGFNVCDFCNNEISIFEGNEGYEDRKYGYIIPMVYGTNGVCLECYEEFIKKGRLYEIDKMPLEEEQEIIDKFFVYNYEQNEEN